MWNIRINLHCYKLLTVVILILLTINAVYFIFPKSSLITNLIQYGAALKIYSAVNLPATISIFGLLTTLIIIFALPLTAVIMILSGYLFGLYGVPVTLLCVTLGASGPYAIARYTASSMLRKRAVNHIEHARKFFNKNQLIYFTLLRLVPLAPFPITSAIGGVLEIKPYLFLSGTFIGTLPACLTFTLIGQQIENLTTAENRLSITLFTQPAFLITTLLVITVFVLPALIVNRYHRK